VSFWTFWASLAQKLAKGEFSCQDESVVNECHHLGKEILHHGMAVVIQESEVLEIQAHVVVLRVRNQQHHD
jgi:hypothetical protein